MILMLQLTTLLHCINNMVLSLLFMNWQLKFILYPTFVHAEIQALTAIQLGGPTPSLCLNLANLAYMRGDQILAIHWLEMASTNFPDFDQIAPVKSKLLQNGMQK